MRWCIVFVNTTHGEREGGGGGGGEGEGGRECERAKISLLYQF